MKPLNISVVGAGYWGRKVIRETLALARTSGQISLHSVVDNSPTVLEQCRKEFGSLDYRLDYHDLLSDPDVSAAHICSPNASHFDIASSFLRSKKHVLVEKPLALRTSEAFELVRLAEANRRVLCVGHVHRFNNGVRELRKVVGSGVLGDIYYLRFRWTGYLPPQKERDVITDLGPHPLDICNHILDVWPRKISCRGRGFRVGMSDEVAFINTEHANGLHANIELSWLDHEKRRDVMVVGSEGMAHLDCLDQKLSLQRADTVEPVTTVPSNTLREEIIHFAKCCSHDLLSASRTNLSGGLLGANVVLLLETARKSLYEERTVQVPLAGWEEIPAEEPNARTYRRVEGRNLRSTLS